MVFRQILCTKWFACSVVAGVSAFLVASSPWAAGLLACGNGGSPCCGGCFQFTGDGAYDTYETCYVTQANLFQNGQGLLLRYFGCQNGGPNVQPEDDGTNVNYQNNAMVNNMMCNTTLLQTAGGTIGTTTSIPHTQCPHQ